MPSEALVARVEQIFNDVAILGGTAEKTSIVTGLEVVDISITGQPNLILVKDNRDGDFIYAVKVPGILYAVSDLVNVLFIDGTEPVAMQQSAGSSGSPVAVSKLVSPDGLTDPVLAADNSGNATLEGNLVVGNDNIATGVIEFNGAAGSSKTMRFQSNFTNRWLIRSNATAESGGDVGSDFEIRRANDAGSLSGVRALFIKRSSGLTAMGVSGAPTPGAQLHIEQSDNAASVPVFLLDQTDVDEPFIKYVGTAAAATLTRSIVAEADVTTATRQGFVKVEIEDIGNQVTDQDYFVPFFTLT